VAGRDLLRSGIEDFVVLEAQEEVGGRIKSFTRENGRKLEKGAEFTGPGQPTVLSIGEDLGLATSPMVDWPEDPEEMGLGVRLHNGQRILEPFPMADDPDATAAFEEAVAAFGTLISELPEDLSDPRCVELDKKTVGEWADENVSNELAREAFVDAALVFGPGYETSLLFALAYAERFKWVEMDPTSIDRRFVTGTSSLIAGLAREIGDRIVLSAPVRKIIHGDDGVTIETDQGAVTAQAVIVAMDPGLVAAIEFDPPVPADRAKLQTRWNGLSGAKVTAIYDEQFWKDEGLSGFGSGGEVSVVAIGSTSAEGEPTLGGMIFAIGSNTEKVSRILQDPELARQAVLEDFAAYFGPKALDAKEVHIFDWHGQRWSQSAGGATLAPGVLTTCGAALTRPLGRVIWAGEAAGTGVYMEAAASAGVAAATEAAKLVSR
ncbi:MAG TPA: NAD(P)/FAD-dependent oxidoreductase, partial [Baekduia sp.]|nr:NAD(P)/FAD-dependent oxidoreductase [Baekduia sp.]